MVPVKAVKAVIKDPEPNGVGVVLSRGPVDGVHMQNKVSAILPTGTARHSRKSA
jgi:hypothetical protein